MNGLSSALIFGCVLRLMWSVGALCGLARAQGPCDPQLIQPQTNPYEYRLRGDRREGIYVQQVGGTPLTIASWTESVEDYDLASSRPLTVEWDAPENIAVNLRAEALRHRFYYRMDAATRPAAGPISGIPICSQPLGFPGRNWGSWASRISQASPRVD